MHKEICTHKHQTVRPLQTVHNRSIFITFPATCPDKNMKPDTTTGSPMPQLGLDYVDVDDYYYHCY